MLTLIKSIHTVVWLIMVTAIFYIVYCGITNQFTIYLWWAVGLIALECLVLLVNRWRCPLTPLAMKFTDERRENFDIYLPRLIARYNKEIFGSITIVGLVLVAINFFRAQ